MTKARMASIAGSGLLTPESSAFNRTAWVMTLGATAAACWAGMIGLVVACCVAPLLFFVHPFMEFAFYMLFYRKKYRLFNALVAHHAVSGEEAWAILRRVCDVLREYKGSQEWISIWFHGAKPADVQRDNVLHLLAYAVWFRTRSQLHADGLDGELLEMLVLLEDALGCTFAEGYNPCVKFMEHLNEPLPHFFRPAAFYVIIEFLCWVGHRALLGAGFTRHTIAGVHHYARPASPAVLAAARQRRRRLAAAAGRPHHQRSARGDAGSGGLWWWFWPVGRWSAGLGSAGSISAGGTGAEDGGAPCRCDDALCRGLLVSEPGSEDEEDAPLAPLVILHGVGLGLIPYMRLVLALATTGAPIVALEFKHVSMRWTDRVPDVSELAADVCAVLDLHGHARCTLVAHSFGTLVASRFAQLYPERMHQLCFMDPICFNMFIPSVLQNFVYRQLSWRKLWLDLLMMGPARELHCSAGMCRRFVWTQVNLWAEHVPPGCLIVLAGQDDLIPATEVYRWLQKHTSANVLYFEHMQHAEILIRSKVQDLLVTQILLTAYGTQRHDSASSQLTLLDRGGGNSDGAVGSKAEEMLDTAASQDLPPPETPAA